MNKLKPAPKQLKPGEGEILTLLGEPRVIKVLPSENQKMTATTGAFLFAPRGALHGFTVVGRNPGRLLITVSPGTQHERFFRDVLEIERTRRKPPERSELLRLAQKHGWVFP